MNIATTASAATTSPTSEAHAGELEVSQAKLPADTSFKAVMALPLRIPAEGKNPTLDFVREQDRTAAVELLLDLCQKAPDRSVVRWAGGCKGFTPEMVDGLFNLVAKGSISPDGQRTFRGAVGSGGTMDFDKTGAESVMITQVPYYMARLFDCMSWSSTPQTYRASLDAERQGSLIVSKYGAHLDHRGHMSILTQNDATSFQAWDGDVRLYVEALQSFAKRGYKVAIGVVNGGDVTKDEALMAISKGIPVILVKGSQRAADELVAAHEAADADQRFEQLYNEAYRRGLLNPDKESVPTADERAKLIRIVDFTNPRTLSAAMDELGLLS